VNFRVNENDVNGRQFTMRIVLFVVSRSDLRG
jgi:hypothetical protein